MAETNPVVSDMSLLTSLGDTPDEVWNKLYEDPSPQLTSRGGLLNRDDPVPTGVVEREFPPIQSPLDRYDCRNNRFARYLADEMETTINQRIEQWGPSRVGVVVGTSTSGIRSAERAMRRQVEGGDFAEDFEYAQMEMGGLGEFLSEYIGAYGPTVTISTSCSSSAKVFNTGIRYLEMDLVDAVVVGGVDTVSELTLNGFDALQLIASERSNPFSKNRSGINIGEGGALFFLEQGEEGVTIEGVGESSDSYQMNAPDPEGDGARRSMEQALEDAGKTPGDIDYINLHGTGTRQNDAMENKAVNRVFGGETPASSTKPFVGHTLGAAGAVEAAFCTMALERARPNSLALLPHLWDGERDPEMAPMELVESAEERDCASPPSVLSNSFAFGGNNCSVVMGITR